MSEKSREKNSAGEVISVVLRHFVKEKESCIDEIPSEIVKTSDPKYHLYKCRKSYFGVMFHLASHLLDSGFLTDELVKSKIKEYLFFVKTVMVKKNNTNRITAEDIKVADDFRDFMIEYLQSIAPNYMVGTNEQRLIENKRYAGEVLADFLRYRNDFIDDLPVEILMPGDKNYSKYKCRDLFFISIEGQIERLIDKGVITKVEDKAKADEFINFVKNKNKPRTTKEDIDYVNAILDYFINLLKSIV